MGDFVHLHLHSEYSLLDGACRIEDIPAAAKAAGHRAVAITDHGVMYGVVGFYKACIAAGIKPIIGCEVYVAEGSRFDRQPRDMDKRHLVLLVKNETGYKNLMYMVSKSFTEGFYSRPGVDLELLEAHSDGLIALSACLGGRIPQSILNDDYAGAESYAAKLRDIFGEGNFYLELQDHSIAEQRKVNAGLLNLSKKLGIPLVATNDVHYLKKTDAETQTVLTCIQTNSVVSDGRPLGLETDEFYYKSTEEMERLFEGFPGAIENTVRIADMCSFDFNFKKRYLPAFKPPEGKAPDKYIRELAAAGLADRVEKGEIVYNDRLGADDYRKRVDYELVVITSLKYSEYFLIVWDFVNYAKQNKIPTGPGRGSGAGSLIAYLLRITDVDPLKYNLLFETFLNPERVSMPDFDIDFCYDRRDEVIKYVNERYGSDHVSQIITFGTLAARAAVRDVGRALGMSYGDVDAVAKLIPQKPGVTLRDAMDSEDLKKLYESSETVKRLVDTAAALEGMPRHASTHAAGVVITDEPIWTYVPLSKTDTAVVTQFDMDTIAELGLLKFDFLALRYLTIISNTEKRIRESEPSFDIEKVPLDDAETYALISSGQTDGMFQLESGGMRQMLTNLRPETVEDIMVAIALYRPGPMDSIPKFIENRRNRENIVYKNDSLRDILVETCGCIVYQEQVMQIFRFVAGYSYGKADIVRRAIAKKKQGVIEQERETFIAGAAAGGMTEEDAAKLFEDMIDFSNYGFKKSHAAAYALISYRTAYLKCHYFATYMAALLTSVLGSEGKVAQYISACEKGGVKISPPDVNASRMDFSVEDGSIRFGLLPIKNVGRTFIESILKERENGAFTSFEDFVERLSASEMNKRQVDALIMSGAFDRLGVFRSRLLKSSEKLIELAAGARKRHIEGQLDMFGKESGQPLPESFGYPDIPELSLRELLGQEKGCTGIYFSGHLLDEYGKHTEAVGAVPMIDLLTAFDGSDPEPRYHEKDMAVVAGIVTRVQNKSTRAGAEMAFVTLEDRWGELELVVFPKVFEEFSGLLAYDRAVAAYGELSAREDEPPKLLVRRMTALIPDSEYHGLPQPPRNAQTPQSQTALPSGAQPQEAQPQTAQSNTAPPKLYLKVDSLTSPLCRRVLGLTAIFEGPVQVVLYDASAGKYVKLNGGSVSPTPFVMREFTELLGDGGVVLK